VSRRRRPGLRWANWPLRFKGVTVLTLPLLMLVAAAGLFYGTTAMERSAQASVTHTRVVQGQIDVIQGLVLDGETGVRGYLLTGDGAFLEPTDLARRQIPSSLTALAGLVGDNPLESSRVGRLRQLLAPGWQLSAAGAPPASDPGGLQAWLVRQKSSTDAIRAVLASMTGTENSLLKGRQATLDRRQEWAEILVGVALAAGIMGGLLAMAAFTRGVARRLRRLRQDADSLHDDKELGPVDESADEVGVISLRLHEAVRRQRQLETESVAARRSAEAANEEKTGFLSRMSHELRTPLNAVLGFSQLLEMDAQPDQRDSLAQIRRAGKHLLELINEVLDISRIESGNLALSPEPVMVSELISEALDMMAPVAAERQITLHGDMEGCDCHVRADRQRSKQVLLNLISNAVKFNRVGGTVDLHCEDGGDGTLRIEVRDNGIGIPAEDLSRLFTPFERLSASSDTEGTGIGLALSLRLAQAMDGRIEATSNVSEGSTFTLVLPLAAELVEGPPEVLPLETAAGEPDPHARQPGRATLLVVEDNLSNVRLLEKILRRRSNWKMLHAGHGRLGLELAAANRPDLILLDLHIPDMPGDEVLRRLKAEPATADIPVAMVSADATPGQIERMIANGAALFLTKPIDVEELLYLLDHTAAAMVPPQD
jgi:signal transduction histidine kinase/ActR/RegA family two-component response regulator